MNLLVIDTETAGLKTQTLLDIGYRIIDLAPDYTFKPCALVPTYGATFTQTACFW